MNTSSLVPTRGFSLPLGEYVRHIFLIARTGQVMSQTSPALAQPELSDALRRPLPIAAALGTGPFGYVRTVIARAAGGPTRVKTDFRSLTRRDVPQLTIDVEVEPDARGPGPRIRVNRQDWAPAGAAGSAGAISVVVIDPEMGVVVDAATFPDAGDDEVVTHSLRRLPLRRRR